MKYLRASVWKSVLQDSTTGTDYNEEGSSIVHTKHWEDMKNARPEKKSQLKIKLLFMIFTKKLKKK